MLSLSIKTKLHEKQHAVKKKHYSHRSMDHWTHEKFQAYSSGSMPYTREHCPVGLCSRECSLQLSRTFYLLHDYINPFHCEYIYRNMLRELFFHFTRIDNSKKAFRFNLLYS